ncbi:acyl-CoA N-acyltransferase [Stipitochalara longipes BDJ]|nr:acyl-CoA N-acyltransferase [Stipitochalara longipes BDJ]
MSLTTNGKATLAIPKVLHGQEEIIIRRAKLRDGPHIGRVASKTYYNTPMTSWISPHREKYPTAYERGFIERAISRMLSPRNETYVACLPSGKIVGAATFQRLGDDASARKMIREVGVVKRFWMWVLRWVFWVYCKVYWWVYGPDRSLDSEAVKTFAGWAKEDTEKYWDSYEERENRWHALSVTVLPEWQGKAIGKKLVAEVMRTAERDGIMVGLESSPSGEGFYRKLGFVLLGRFTHVLEEVSEDGGGEMAWYPEGHKNKIGGEI